MAHMTFVTRAWVRHIYIYIYKCERCGKPLTSESVPCIQLNSLVSLAALGLQAG